MEDIATQLKLENQICFPLYAVSRLVIQQYKPLLDELGVTYPQYLVLLVLWENDAQTVSALSEQLYLESNTLTPLLKRMETKGLLERKRSKEDERKVIIHLLPKGQEIQEEAFCIPELILGQFEGSEMTLEEVIQFKTGLNKVLQLLGAKAK